MSLDGVAPPTDNGLVERLQQGDPDALEACYRQWGALVYSIARRLLTDPHLAEDITQQVFLSAWKSRHTLDPAAGSLSAWLVAITRRRVADHVRSQATQAAVSLHASPPEPTTQGTDDEVVSAVHLAAELRALGEPRTTIVRMAVVEGWTHEAIAAHLDMPLGSVKSHLRRSLLRLRQRVQEVPW